MFLVNVRCFAVEELVATESSERIGDVATIIFSLIREGEVGKNKIIWFDDRENRVGFCVGFDGVVRCRKMFSIVVVKELAGDFSS